MRAPAKNDKRDNNLSNTPDLRTKLIKASLAGISNSSQDDLDNFSMNRM